MCTLCIGHFTKSVVLGLSGIHCMMYYCLIRRDHRFMHVHCTHTVLYLCHHIGECAPSTYIYFRLPELGLLCFTLLCYSYLYTAMCMIQRTAHVLLCINTVRFMYTACYTHLPLPSLIVQILFIQLISVPVLL
jgi:hypothetical protein